MTLYPTGYNTSMVDIDELFKRHHPDKIHPEFARRLRMWLESKGGRIGIGGSWRAIQPPKPGFAPEGRSFHQSQQFSSGRVAYCAVDLVHINPGGRHRSPRWEEVPRKSTVEARHWGLHCNVTKPAEPWHIQPIEIDGWGGWNRSGRKDFSAMTVTPVTLPTPPAPALVFAYPGQPLRRGSQGDAVKLIQAVVGATPDGVFGSATDRRVRAWQKTRGMHVDGVVGPVTWRAMFG
jgi:peptidoglycan hydrolase-like protein with peptidoglycan-binding domain